MSEHQKGRKGFYMLLYVGEDSGAIGKKTSSPTGEEEGRNFFHGWKDGTW